MNEFEGWIYPGHRLGVLHEKEIIGQCEIVLKF